MRYLGNAFSAGMLAESADISFEHVPLEYARRWIRAEAYTSVVGHTDTAALLTELLGVDVPCRRGQGITLSPGDELLVAQYNGPRLPEGTTTLPEGAAIRWILIWHRRDWCSCGCGRYGDVHIATEKCADRIPW